MSDQFVCKTCCMDRTAEEIEFTETGCTFCDLARKMEPEPFKPVSFSIDAPEYRLDKKSWVEVHRDTLLKKVLKTNHPKYDVLLGLSGGLDSSYCLYLLKQMGIRVLAFTIDNGYNTPQADENIMKLVEGMKVPFFRYTIDTAKFAELQSAFMKAGQKNVEIPTDHILMAASYQIANTYGIKTIISGGNWASESIMPMSWGYQPRDLKHMRDVARRHGAKNSLRALPTCGIFKFNYYKWIRRIKTVNLLDYFDYIREKAIKALEQYDYKPFEEKHTENYFTWWFQNFYLFEKFGIDKRKAHLSSLIVSGQMTRDEALIELQKNPVYPTLGIEARVMQYPKRPYTDFKTDEWLWNFISKLIKHGRTIGLFN